ncbi:tetratricopeptide repeat protein, partial [bacterium]|nr:tetratricopeptide repeat protein [bacterium]
WGDLRRPSVCPAWGDLRRPRPLSTGATEDDADALYDLGCELETSSPARAEDAYARALELEPDHAEAHTNLGRLLHQRGEVKSAEAHYRRALEAKPDDATAWFNLGVALEDQIRRSPAPAVASGAIHAYERALALDPSFADADYNLACLHERLGERTEAFRHLAAYRRRVRPRSLE